MTGKGYLFVAGVARSGTSALTDLLNAHPAIVIGMERYFNLVTDARYRQLDRHLLEPARFLSPVEDETHNFRWRDDEKFRGFLEHKLATARIVGDKVPNYYCFADHLLSTFPGSRMLLITRDPLRVADSWKRRQTDPDDTVWHAGADVGLRQWNGGHRRMLAVARRYPERVGVVVYEELFSGHDTTFSRLLDWLDAGPRNTWTDETFRSMTDGWSSRLSARLTLSDEEQAHVRSEANVAIRHELIELAGI